jgi:hypothetical protein
MAYRSNNIKYFKDTILIFVNKLSQKLILIRSVAEKEVG